MERERATEREVRSDGLCVSTISPISLRKINQYINQRGKKIGINKN